MKATPKALPQTSAEDLFLQGKYRDLLEAYHDSSRPSRPKELPFVLGALVFSGRGDEAISLFPQIESTQQGDAISAGRFFLMIHFVRSGEIEKAKALRSGIEARSPRTATQRFYRAQSAAFFDYYLGRRLSCEGLLNEALGAALEARFVWGRILVIDMLGHIQFETGRIQESLKNFTQVLELAERIGNSNLAEAIRVTIALYRARVSIPGPDSIAELEAVFRSTRVDDNYSRANVLLEIARQTTLVGRWHQANEVLNRALRHVYQYSNAKQEVVLNLRWAYLEFCQGESPKALNYLSIAKAKAQAGTDEAVLLSIWGLEREVLSELEFSAEFLDAFERNHSAAASSHTSYVNERIASRATGLASPVRRGEDAFGDRLDELHQSRYSPEAIIESGLLGLLKAKRILPARKPCLAVNAATREIIASDHSAVERFSFRSKPKLFDFAVALLEGGHEKAELFSRIWGGRYVPHLHDSVLYTNAANLRKSLGSFAYFIETSSNGYRLNPNLGLQVIFFSRPREEPEETKTRSQVRSRRAPLQLERRVGLNPRQARLLESLGPGDLIDTRTYSRLLKVSTATANRDLRNLAEQGQLVRSGRSRDIAYSLPT